jgi:hypothetical protein
MTEEYEDNFTNGIFWELYKDLEHQFESFLEYVPFLEGNEQVYSFKLLNLILGIGGHIDSAFKEMARCPEFSSNEACKKILKQLESATLRIQSGKPPIPVSIKLCLEAFESEYNLSEKYVVFKRRLVPHVITPFRSWGSKSVPDWWTMYNDLKHDAGINIRKANLITTLDALAGAFLLNVIHIPAAVRMYRHGMIKPAPPVFGKILRGPAQTYYLTTEEQLKLYYQKHKHFLGIMETPLFIFNHEEERK